MAETSPGVHRLGSDRVNFYPVLPGHGEPWRREGVAAAVARAREAGPS